MRQSAATESLISANRAAVRGVLILMVMLDHNDIIRAVRGVDAWFKPMTWHVAGFLLLPFLGHAWTLGRKSIRDAAVRTLVPYAAAVLVYAAIFHVVRAPPHNGVMARIDWLLALFVGSADVLKQGTGFFMLWFLPALFSLRLLLAVVDTGRRDMRLSWLIVVGAAALLAQLYVGIAPTWAKDWTPQGLLIALYILPIGLLLRAVMTGLGDSWHHWRVATFCVAVSLLCWWALIGHDIEVATLELPTIMRPVRLLLVDVADVAFLLGLLGFAPLLARIPVLQLLGRYSLVVYLVHPLLYKPIFAILLPLSLHQDRLSLVGGLIYWGLAAASVAIVGVLSVAAAAIVAECHWLRRAVTPRDWADWQPIRWRATRGLPLH